MNLYPAIDIFQGKAVQLRQGRREEATVYGDPVDMAERWVRCGARWLHIVDLDGAFEGRPRNSDMVECIRARCPGVRIQVGGGIRDMAAVARLIHVGVDRVILGTAAVQDSRLLAQALEQFGERIVVGIDALAEVVRLDGWTRGASATTVEFAQQMEKAGVGLIIYTDISRAGRQHRCQPADARGHRNATHCLGRRLGDRRPHQAPGTGAPTP
jgi:phosphoribosylformimino-5-aminoimidazole carboxamide ribotide isomerase